MISKTNKLHNLFEKINIVTTEHLQKASRDNFERLKNHLNLNDTIMGVDNLIEKSGAVLDIINQNYSSRMKNLIAKNTNLTKAMKSLSNPQIGSSTLIPEL
jgi:uncharacterized protein YeeX (DUF496 family)